MTVGVTIAVIHVGSGSKEPTYCSKEADTGSLTFTRTNAAAVEGWDLPLGMEKFNTSKQGRYQ